MRALKWPWDTGFDEENQTRRRIDSLYFASTGFMVSAYNYWQERQDWAGWRQKIIAGFSVRD